VDISESVRRRIWPQCIIGTRKHDISKLRRNALVLSRFRWSVTLTSDCATPVRRVDSLGTLSQKLTVHFPKEVRHQLKILAAEQDKHIETMVAEALNLLFAKYRKGEIAPVKGA
jgi:hypothetical protein